MSRPGFLCGDKAYYAAWLEGTDEEENSKQTPVIFSNDFCEIYCDEDLESDHKHFSDAPMDIRIEASPRPGTSMSTQAFIRHVIEKEPLPELAEVFISVRDSINRFVAFDGTLGTQEEMCEFLACWVISTYATEAFGTVGYLWPTGEKGSGKTQCLNAVIRLSYLGLVTTSSSSFPAIRNNAILGGTIGFDDCENIKGMEQNKRELLLAGNSKGAQVMLMEPGKKEGQWQEKYINAFAPRAFTSISIPDEVLASRTITPQLIKSSDLERTRRSPSSPEDWVLEPAKIVDNVWLSVAAGFISIVEKKADVSDAVGTHGREFDIFLPSLTIANWLQDEGGVEGLFGRMKALMERYLEQRTEIQIPTPAEVLLPVLFREVAKEGPKELTTATILQQFQTACRTRDITDPTYVEMDAQRMGQLLGRLGLERSPSHGKQRSWIISEDCVGKAARNQGINLPEAIGRPDKNESSELVAPTLIRTPASEPFYEEKKLALPWD